MLKKLWELTATILTLARDLQQYRQEQERMRRDLADLTIIVRLLSQEIKHSKEQTATEHARLLTELENKLLRYEKALPAAKRPGRPPSKKGSKK